MPIPPLPDSRKRSIRIWLETYRPKDFSQMKKAGTLDQYVKETDAQMWEEFLETNSVINSLVAEKIQGTPEGLIQYQTRTREAWERIFHKYLPAQESEPAQ